MKQFFRTLVIFIAILLGLGLTGLAFLLFGWLILIPFGMGVIWCIASEIGKKSTAKPPR